jgi:hypothetical protein
LLPLLPGLTRPHLPLVPPIIEHPLIIEFPQRNNDINGIYDLICIWGYLISGATGLGIKPLTHVSIFFRLVLTEILLQFITFCVDRKLVPFSIQHGPNNYLYSCSCCYSTCYRRSNPTHTRHHRQGRLGVVSLCSMIIFDFVT